MSDFLIYWTCPTCGERVRMQYSIATDEFLCACGGKVPKSAWLDWLAEDDDG